MIKKIIIIFLSLFFCLGCSNIENKTNTHVLNLLDKGSGEIVTDELNQKEIDLLSSYFDSYFEHLAKLEKYDFDGLFSNEINRKVNELALEIQVEFRKLQEVDYSLLAYSYSFKVEEVERKNNKVYIKGHSSDVENFAATPHVDSIRYSDAHIFVLEETNNQLLIYSHQCLDSYRNILYEDDWDSVDKINLDLFVDNQPKYLEKIKAAFDKRLLERNYRLLMKSYKHSYDRESAVAYSYKYVNKRNSKFPDYNKNCQNFASQCLLAGNIPLDLNGPYYWKYFEDYVKEDSSNHGRTPSWTGVKMFIDYSNGNKDFGLAATYDAPYYMGQPGDLLHFAYNNEFKHTVIITDTVVANDGRVVDYLTNSNTSDLQDYPASLYGYPQIVLNHIFGYND